MARLTRVPRSNAPTEARIVPHDAFAAPPTAIDGVTALVRVTARPRPAQKPRVQPCARTASVTTLSASPYGALSAA
jgi:hypothetical protein